MVRIAQEFADAPYHALDRGQVFESTYNITPELVETYNRLVGHADQPLSRVVPPWVYCSFLPLYRALGGRMEQGSVHTRQKVEHVAPTQVGEVLDVQVRVADKFERDGKRHVVLDIEFYGIAHDLRCRIETVVLWGYSAP